MSFESDIKSVAATIADLQAMLSVKADFIFPKMPNPPFLPQISSGNFDFGKFAAQSTRYFTEKSGGQRAIAVEAADEEYILGVFLCFSDGGEAVGVDSVGNNANFVGAEAAGG